MFFWRFLEHVTEAVPSMYDDVGLDFFFTCAVQLHFERVQLRKQTRNKTCPWNMPPTEHVHILPNASVAKEAGKLENDNKILLMDATKNEKKNKTSKAFES